MIAYIGVDPGKTGSIAIISLAETLVYDFEDPKTLTALRVARDHYNCMALVEKVNSMPKQGVASSFKFGTSYGIIRGWLEALGIRYELITPGKWWKQVSDSAPKGDDKKTAALELARRLFPELAATHLTRKKDHNRAEALLIAECLRRREL